MSYSIFAQQVGIPLPYLTVYCQKQILKILYHGYYIDFRDIIKNTILLEIVLTKKKKRQTKFNWKWVNKLT